MLFPSEEHKKENRKQMRTINQGRGSIAAARRLLELDPHFGPAHLLFGTVSLDAGRFVEAEEHFWEGLAEHPCTYLFYFALGDARKRRGRVEDDLTRGLTVLTSRKLQRLEELPPEAEELFAGALDPLDVADDLRIDPRLRPFFLLDDLLEQADEEMDEDLLEQIRASPDDMVPVLESALREWARNEETIGLEALCFAIALLGEMAPVQTLDNLLEVSMLGEPALFLHSHWAIWRMGERFPDETLRRLRARIPQAPLVLRCGIAEHLCLMPPNPLVPFTAHLLLEGFAKLARQEDALYLLAATVHALELQGCGDEARQELERCRALLPKDKQVVLAELTEEGFTPNMVREEISEFDIEDVCLMRIFMDDEEEDGEDEDGEDVPIHKRLFGDLMLASEEWDPKMEKARQAAVKFFGPSPSKEMLTSDDGFGQWYICQFRPSPGAETTVERYLRERAGELEPRDRAMLESWRDARFGFYETIRVEPGRGIELQDLCGPDRMFVDDVTSSRELKKRDGTLCRLEFFEGKWYLGGDGMLVPGAIRAEFLGLIQREAGRAGVEKGTWVRANAHQLHLRVRELLAAHAPKPKILHFDDQAFEFCSATYQLLDHGRAIAGLLKCPEFERTGNDIAWLQPGKGEARRSLGRMSIGGGKLRLECHSRKQLERGRRLIEKFAGAHVRHSDDAFKALEF